MSGHRKQDRLSEELVVLLFQLRWMGNRTEVRMCVNEYGEFEYRVLFQCGDITDSAYFSSLKKTVKALRKFRNKLWGERQKPSTELDDFVKRADEFVCTNRATVATQNAWAWIKGACLPEQTDVTPDP